MPVSGVHQGIKDGHSSARDPDERALLTSSWVAG
jgi:hypothetical protein